MLKRDEILKLYATENDCITSPGRFEREPIWVPYFWTIFLDGGADEDDGSVLTFNIDAEDRAEFPGLLDDVGQVYLWQDDNGFVHSEIREREDASS